MRRLLAVVTGLAVLAGGLLLAPPASASTEWVFPDSSFTVDDAFGNQAVIIVKNLRITDGVSATGGVFVSAVKASCSTSSFTGLTANFFLGLYEPCVGPVTFSVDQNGQLAVDSGLKVRQYLFTGPASGSAVGVKYPPELTCTATAAGSSDIQVAWADSGSGATGYTVSATPALPQTVNVSAGPTQTTVSGLAPGTQYDFTVATVGPWVGSASCTAVTDALTPPVGSVSYGVITGSSSQAEREYTLSTQAPPAGWSVQWLLSSGMQVTAHGSQLCGTTSTVTPQWSMAGQAPVVGAPVVIATQCNVPVPVMAPAPVSFVNGGTVTVNYLFPAGFEAGTVVWASFQVESSGKVFGPVSLGTPPAGGSSGSASVTVPGLQAPAGVRVQLFAVNGPVSSGKSPWVLLPGEKAPVSGAPTAPAAPTTPVPGASTGTPGGSSGSTGSGTPGDGCLAPNGVIFSDAVGSVGSTLTLAPNLFGFAQPASFTVTGGALPAGVRLDGSFGVVSGTPEVSNAGVGPVEVTVRWVDGTVRVFYFNIAVDNPHHAVNYPNRVIGSVGQYLTVNPMLVNSSGTRSFRLVCGTTPAGVVFDERTGVFAGTPTSLSQAPTPLRVRMFDRYGWVDSSLLLVVNPGVTPWLAYPEFMQVGVGRKVAVHPTRSGMPLGVRYWLSEGLPQGLKFNARTGAITGSSVVNDGFIHEPTILAVGPDGKPVASTKVSLTVVKPAVPMRVTARKASKVVKPGRTVLVTRVKHPRNVALSVRVSCGGCTYSFNKRSGRLVVVVPKGARKVVVWVTGQPRVKKAAYAGHVWSRTWKVRRHR